MGSSQYIFNISAAFYGQFSQIHKYFLTKIVEKHINKTKRVGGRAEFRGYYIDNNNNTLRKGGLKKWEKPQKRIEPKKGLTSAKKYQPSVETVIEHNIKPQMSGWSMNKSAANVYRLLNESVSGINVPTLLNDSRLSFAHLKGIFTKKPELLDNPNVVRYINTKAKGDNKHFLKLLDIPKIATK